MSDDSKKVPPAEAIKQRPIENVSNVQTEGAEGPETDTGWEDAVVHSLVQGYLEEQRDTRRFRGAAIALEQFVNAGARPLDQLLMSTQSWPFASRLQLEERFGKLADGYVYRYLAPYSSQVPKEIAQNANNIIRLPTLLDEEVKKWYYRSADEFPDSRCLDDWLASQSADVQRLWALRILSRLGILKDGPEGAGAPTPGSVPMVGKASVVVTSFESAEINADIEELIEEFLEMCIIHCNAEVENEDDVEANESVDALGAVCRKRSIVNELSELAPNGREALRPLLDHPNPGVRVSAGVYLLPTLPGIVTPILWEIATMSTPEELKQKHAHIAAIHARQTLWMYEDGNLKV